MATRHGLAGQYGKSEAWQRTQRIFGSALIAVGVFTAVISSLAGWLTAKGGAWPLLAVPLLLIIYALSQRYVNRSIYPLMDALSRERLKFLRGGQTEALVAWMLEDLENAWHIFNTIKLEKQSDIDHVLVGPGGLFCISTKSHRGYFKGLGDGLLYNGKPSDFADQAIYQAMRLKDRLTAMMGSDVPWIQPVLAVPFGYVDGDACGGKVWVVHQETLKDRLAPDDGPKKLKPEQIARLVKVLEMIQNSAAEVFTRPRTAENAR